MSAKLSPPGPRCQTRGRPGTTPTRRSVEVGLHAILGLLACLPNAGCAGLDLATVTDRVPQYVQVTSIPSNAIERGLAFCPDKTTDAEPGCVRRALADAGTSVTGLLALLPGCVPGRACDYDYTTTDRLGFLGPDASLFKVRWRVTFDLKKPPASVADVPITVIQR